MESIFLATVIANATTACPPGEFALAATCWPCPPGSFCVSAAPQPCAEGAWSGAAGATACAPCTECEWLRAVRCSPTLDAVCAGCPSGHECAGGVATPCARGRFSAGGAMMCEPCERNHTTAAEGATSAADCACEDPQPDGGCRACEAGSLAIGGGCRPCPAGHSCTPARAEPCGPNTYSLLGACARCPAHSHSGPGASACECEAGYTATGGGACAPCAAGTVHNGSACVGCAEGEFCLGRTHHEPCPPDTFARGGAAICAACRPDSECASRCVDASSCLCGDGFIDLGDECRRCPVGAQKVSRSRCAPCSAGFECRGGPDVRECAIGTFSRGNRSACTRCSECEEVTASRCNHTHDSACAAATYPFAIMTIHQRFTTDMTDQFRVFAMVYASSVPRTQVVRFCDGRTCVECFQGLCPLAPLLSPPAYELVMEMRSNADRLPVNIETLTQSSYLQRTAAAAMAKVTDRPFVLVETAVEHRVVCPEGAQWDGRECVGSAARTWMGLAVVAAVTMGMAAYYRRRKAVAGAKWEAVPAAVVEGGS